RTRDDAEAVLREPRDRHIAHDVAALVDELRVDDRADRAVDARVAHALEHVEIGRLELAERCHVDDPEALSDRGVLDGDPVVPGRPRPADRALVLPGPPRRLARAEVVGALPAVLRPEDRAERLE